MNTSYKLRLLAALLAAAGFLSACGGGGGGGSSSGSNNSGSGADSGGNTGGGDNSGGGNTGGDGSNSGGDTGGGDSGGGNSGGNTGGGDTGNGGGSTGGGDTGGGTGGGDTGGGNGGGDTGGGNGGGAGAASGCLNSTLYNTASTSHLEYKISGLYNGTSVSNFQHNPGKNFEGKTASEFIGDVTTNYIGVGTFHDNVKSYTQLDNLEMVRLGTLYDITAAGLTGNGKAVYSPPYRDRRYALAAGDSFTATYDVVATQTFSGLPPMTVTTTETITVEYVGRETVTVPLGTFETCRFEVNGGETVEWDAVSSGLMVKSVSTTDGGTLTLEMTVGTINGASIKQ